MISTELDEALAQLKKNRRKTRAITERIRFRTSKMSATHTCPS